MIHGHLLKPGDIARTELAGRAARGHPIRPAAGSAGRHPAGHSSCRGTGTLWIRDRPTSRDIALPLYQGRMMQFNAFVPSVAWMDLQRQLDSPGQVGLNGNTRARADVEPTVPESEPSSCSTQRATHLARMRGTKIGIRITSLEVRTTRTIIAPVTPRPFPCGHIPSVS